MKPYSVTIQTKGFEEYFHVVLLTVQFSVKIGSLKFELCAV